MGSPNDEPCRNKGEKQHRVVLSGSFVLRQHEVTRGELSRVMPKELMPAVNWDGDWQSRICHAACQQKNDKESCTQDCPMTGVSWHLAAAYANQLTLVELEKKCQVCLNEGGRITCKPADPSYCQCYRCTGTGHSLACGTAPQYEGEKIYSCPGYRLPTEAEWEYAYRAGGTTALHTGPLATCEDVDDANAQAAGWYQRNAKLALEAKIEISLHPGGEKVPNAWGLHDMAGNLLEWVHSAHAEYSAVEEELDPNPKESEVRPLTRVVRGGSYASPAPELRAAARAALDPNAALNHLGFRVARTVF
jgi:formylglycine-generating enzyme required for sulfatase activity